jgi:hypothetical protein
MLFFFLYIRYPRWLPLQERVIVAVLA